MVAGTPDYNSRDADNDGFGDPAQRSSFTTRRAVSGDSDCDNPQAECVPGAGNPL
jgi:hypothetical protein